MNSSKHGMIGKRGRHKATKKQSKVEFEPDEAPDAPNAEDSMISSDSFSPKKAPKK
jgi:hypothetical protein